VIYVRTKGGVKPEEALRRAVEKVRETSKGFSKELGRSLKTT
jgi:DNA-directed RNA polymerase subunit L